MFLRHQRIPKINKSNQKKKNICEPKIETFKTNKNSLEGDAGYYCWEESCCMSTSLIHFDMAPRVPSSLSCPLFRVFASALQVSSCGGPEAERGRRQGASLKGEGGGHHSESKRSPSSQCQTDESGGRRDSLLSVLRAQSSSHRW